MASWVVLKKVVKTIIKQTLYALGYFFLIPLSCLIPKAGYLVLTSRFGDFEGNLKYFYLYLHELQDVDIEVVFLTEKREVYKELKEKGFRVWFYPSLSAIMKMLRTKILIVDGNEWTKNLKYFLLFKAKKVQVWHGTGIKTIGLLKPAVKKLGKLRTMLKKEYTFYDILVLTSEYQVQVRGKAFRYEKLFINGYSRNDIFFGNHISLNGLGCDLKVVEQCRAFRSRGLAVVTYAPTWRKNTNSLQMDLTRLNDFSRRNNFIFILKLHYKHDCTIDVSNHSNIFAYDKHKDVYPLLALTDILITDYSSIYMDFLLLDRPILFYPYDREDYIDLERALLLDYDNITPGPISHNQEELHRQIYQHLIGGVDLYKTRRNKERNRFFRFQDGNSSPRLWEEIRENVLDKG